MNYEKTDSTILDTNFSDNNEFSVNYAKSYNNGDLLDDYFDNENVKKTNTNNIEVLYIPSNNSLLDFSTMKKRNRVIYIADIACKAGFISFTNIFLDFKTDIPSFLSTIASIV